MFGNPKNEAALHILPLMGNEAYKYYYNNAYSPLKCSVVYLKRKIRVNVEFDNDTVKYLGVWMNPGDLNGMYNVAVEPCTALYDNPVNAEKANVGSYVKAKEEIKFALKLTYNEE